MNKRILIWLIIVYPVGLYLLFKEKKKSRSDSEVVSRIFRTFDFVRGLRWLVSSGQAVVQ